MPITRDLFEEQVFFNTVLIENQILSTSGTGFLLVKNFGNRKKQLIFSNKHVFWGDNYQNPRETKVNLFITFHVKNIDGSYQLGNVKKVSLELDKKNDGYYEHEDKDIDVACINISDAYNKIPIENRSIDPKDFFNFDISTLVIGQRIVFIGYPEKFFDVKNFLPVARFGSIASIPSIDFNGKKQILIDAAVFPGSSGSPVFFLSKENQYKLLGIISSGPIRELEYIKISTGKSIIPVQFINFGMIFKLDTIKEVFEKVL